VTLSARVRHRPGQLASVRWLTVETGRGWQRDITQRLDPSHRLVCKTGGVEQRQRTLRPEKSCRSDEGRGFDSRHLHSRFRAGRAGSGTAELGPVGGASRRPQSADRLV